MKKMLIAAIAAVLVLGTAGMSMAAKDKAAKKATTQPTTDKALKGGPFAKLDLTEEQKAKVKEIMDQARTDAKAAAEGKTDKKEIAKARAEIMKAAMEKVKTTVLTDDQRKKLEELQKDAKAAHGKKAHGAKADKADKAAADDKAAE